MTKLFVIDTNKYSGNFERSLFSFLTCFEDEEVYDYTKMIALHGDSINPDLQNWWANNISTYNFDEEYRDRVVGIIPTPGFFNDGLGQHFPNDAIDPPVKTPNKWPAYQSVGIAIACDTIDDHILKLIKERVDEYVKLGVIKGLEIIGYRMVTIKVTKTEETVNI